MVLFENVFADSDGTLSATSEASGFEVENINDWRIGTIYRWKATDTTSPQYLTMDLGLNVASAPDTLVIAGNNFVEAMTVNGYKVEYQVTDGSGWNDLFAESAPASNVVEIQTFTAVSARYFRLTLTRAGGFDAVPHIGVVTLGRRLNFDEGCPESIDPYQQHAITDDPRTRGTYLGANVRFKKKFFRIEWPEPGLQKSTFFQPASGVTFDTDFVDHAIKGALPFWFSWNTADTVDPGPYLCRCRGVVSPFLGSYKRRMLSATFEAFRAVA